MKSAKAPRAAKWSRLDNAAKIFPSTSSRRDPKVFRFSCELNDPIELEALQRALELTVELFPHFRSVVRRGLFWYYLEQSTIEPIATVEADPPCSPIYSSVKKELLFAVTCYRRRISLEVYHALTDGTGALQFLRVLVSNYLPIRYPDAFGADPPSLNYDASITERGDDSFRKYYAPEKKGKRVQPPKAYRLTGTRLPGCAIRVIEGVMPAGLTKEKARGMGTSLTAFIAAAMICAIHAEAPLRDRKKPVVISIPVNLRNYFESESARNFFGLFTVSHTFDDGDAGDTATLAKAAASVSTAFLRELDADRLARRMNELAALEHNAFARIVPLFLKDIILRVYNALHARGETTSISNLGRIDMPEGFAPYISRFDVFISANRPQLCVCSYHDSLVLTMTSPFESTDVQKRFFRIFSSMGIPVTIYSNQPEEE